MTLMSEEVISHYCETWELSDPVCLARTFTSDVYKVRRQGTNAVLKVLNENGKKFESRGADVLRCFDGNGAVYLLAADEGAHLLEYIDGPELRTLVAQGKDAEAAEVLCGVIEKIHTYSGPIPVSLISMERNFRALFLKANEHGDGLYCAGAKIARELLDSAREPKVLHGDIHHANVLQHSERGWLAIDPQCLAGENTYDFANAFYNPTGFFRLVSDVERIKSLCELFAKRSGIDGKRILEFAFAYGCLSACWSIEDGQNPEETLEVVRVIKGLLCV